MTATIEVLGLADRCLANTVAHFARHAHGGGVEDHDGLVLFAGSHPYPGPYCNGAIRLDREVGVDDLLARSREFFAPRRRGFILWARADTDHDLIERCRAEGWHERPPVEGMPIIRLAREDLRVPADRPVGPGIERIRTEADAEAYLQLLAAAYDVGQVPRNILESIFCTPAAILAPETFAVLSRVGGRAVAASMVVTVDNTSCSLYTATAPDVRRSGLGGALMLAKFKAVFESGVDVIYAQSSQMGLRRWLQIGFEEIGHYHRFLAPPQR